MTPLRNISVNLHAAGPAAVAVCWPVCVVALGLLGTGGLAAKALNLLTFAGAFIGLGLAGK